MHFFSRDDIEEDLTKLKETAFKIELLEMMGNHEVANELRLKVIYNLSKLFKKCKHRKNRKVILEQLLWWIETSIPKIVNNERVIHLDLRNVELREYSEP